MCQKLVEPKHKIKTFSGLRDFSVCTNQRIFLAVIYDTVRIYDIDYQSPTHIIKLDATPRQAKLSQCGKYFYIHDTNNTIYLYDTRLGLIIQQIGGTPTATKTIRFSQNSQKLIFASTQLLCLWNIKKCQIDVRTEHWKNINCYDVNKDGSKFAIGTYNGVIYALDFLQVGRCSQIQIKRHKTCVVAICCHDSKIISASQDSYFLISTISKDVNDERIITYHEMKMKSIPKQIQSVGNNFYMFNNEGMTWFYRAHGLTLTGFTDYKSYRPLVNQNGQTIFVSLNTGELEWWPASIFKTASQLQKAKKQKQKQRRLSIHKQSNQQIMNKENNHQIGKQNKFTFRAIYRR